jgi:hypothetical protein
MDRKNIDMQEKLLCIIVTAAGQDITAPEEIVKSEMESFKAIKNIEDNDALIDCLVAMDNVESDQEKLEIIKVICMKMLPLTKTFKMMSFLQEYGAHMFEYFEEHPDVCKEGTMDNALDALFDDN